MTDWQNNDWISAYLDDELSSGERREAEERIANDPVLKAQVEKMRQLGAKLRALPTHRLPANFATRVADLACGREPVTPPASPLPPVSEQPLVANAASTQKARPGVGSASRLPAPGSPRTGWYIAVGVIGSLAAMLFLSLAIPTAFWKLSEVTTAATDSAAAAPMGAIDSLDEEASLSSEAGAEDWDSASEEPTAARQSGAAAFGGRGAGNSEEFAENSTPVPPQSVRPDGVRSAANDQVADAMRKQEYRQNLGGALPSAPESAPDAAPGRAGNDVGRNNPVDRARGRSMDRQPGSEAAESNPFPLEQSRPMSAATDVELQESVSGGLALKPDGSRGGSREAMRALGLQAEMGRRGLSDSDLDLLATVVISDGPTTKSLTDALANNQFYFHEQGFQQFGNGASERLAVSGATPFNAPGSSIEQNQLQYDSRQGGGGPEAMVPGTGGFGGGGYGGTTNRYHRAQGSGVQAGGGGLGGGGAAGPGGMLGGAGAGGAGAGGAGAGDPTGGQDPSAQPTQKPAGPKAGVPAPAGGAGGEGGEVRSTAGDQTQDTEAGADVPSRPKSGAVAQAGRPEDRPESESRSYRDESGSALMLQRELVDANRRSRAYFSDQLSQDRGPVLLEVEGYPEQIEGLLNDLSGSSEVVVYSFAQEIDEAEFAQAVEDDVREKHIEIQGGGSAVASNSNDSGESAGGSGEGEPGTGDAPAATAGSDTLSEPDVDTTPDVSVAQNSDKNESLGESVGSEFEEAVNFEFGYFRPSSDIALLSKLFGVRESNREIRPLMRAKQSRSDEQEALVRGIVAQAERSRLLSEMKRIKTGEADSMAVLGDDGQVDQNANGVVPSDVTNANGASADGLKPRAVSEPGTGAAGEPPVTRNTEAGPMGRNLKPAPEAVAENEAAVEWEGIVAKSNWDRSRRQRLRLYLLVVPESGSVERPAIEDAAERAQPEPPTESSDETSPAESNGEVESEGPSQQESGDGNNR